MNSLALRFGGRRLAIRDTRRRRQSASINGYRYDNATVKVIIGGQTITLSNISFHCGVSVTYESCCAEHCPSVIGGPYGSVVASETVDVAKMPRAVDVTVKGVVPAPVVFGAERVMEGE